MKTLKIKISNRAANRLQLLAEVYYSTKSTPAKVASDLIRKEVIKNW